MKTCQHYGRGMTRRIAEVAGAINFLSQPLIVELKKFNVRMSMTRGVRTEGRRERGGRGRDVLPESKVPCYSLWTAFLERDPEMRRLKNLPLPLNSSAKTSADSCCIEGPGSDPTGLGSD